MRLRHGKRQAVQKTRACLFLNPVEQGGMALLSRFELVLAHTLPPGMLYGPNMAEEQMSSTSHFPKEFRNALARYLRRLG